MDKFEPYLKPTEAINSEHETIQEVVENVTYDCTSDVKKAVKLFYFVRDSIRYNIYMVSVFIDDFKASTVLRRGKGYCVQKAVLLTALGRAAGIPSRLSFAKIKNHRIPIHLMEKTGTNIFPRHGYNQFFLSGRWISATATFDRELCQKNELPTVEFDGIHDTFLSQTDLNGNPYIEYLEKYGPQADLPLEWITKEIAKLWGPEKRAWINERDSKQS